MRQHIDNGSIVIIVITAILFTVALFVKGLTQDMLLEAGVLLVSIKIIMMAYKNSVANAKIQAELAELRDLMKEVRDHQLDADPNRSR